MIKEKRYMYVGVSLLLIVIILSGFTYAVLTWTSTKTNIGINTDCFTIDYTKGNNITGKLKLLNESDLISEDNKFTIKEGVGLSYANIGIKSTCNIEGYGKIILNITSISDAFINGDSKGALKYAILSNTSTGIVSVNTLKDQSFDVVAKGSVTGTSSLDILVKQLSNSEVYNYLIVIYIDNDLAGNDAPSGIFKGNISAEAYQGKYTFATIVSNLYNNSSTIPVENNSITYQYDIEHYLMKDVGGNIRYYGANPDNYVYFNCDDYSNQSDSTCEKWRVIGVFDGKVKIMRNSIIGTYSWDNKDTTTGAEMKNGKNDWTDARLMKLLNPGYDNEEVGGSLYYNAGNGNCYAGQSNATKSCNFTTTGLKNVVTRSLISESTWYLRGSNASFSNDAYEYERTKGSVYDSTRKTSWIGKVAMPYPSDYGYAADFRECTVILTSYNNSSCTGNNWMNKNITNNGGTLGWLLTPSSGNPIYAWLVDSPGNVYMSVNGAYSVYGVTPTLYLDSDQEMESGTGKIDDPYRLKV